MTRLDSRLKILGLSQPSHFTAALKQSHLARRVVCLRRVQLHSLRWKRRERARKKWGKEDQKEKKEEDDEMAVARAMGRAACSPDGLVGGNAVEERERVAGGGDAAAGQGAALEVLEGDEAGGLGRGGEVAEDVLEEALVAGERDGPRAGPRREPVLLLRLPEQLPEHGVVQVRRPHHEPPRRAAHAHRHVARRDRRLHRRARRRAGPPPPQRLPEPHDVPDLAAAFRHVDARASE